MAHGAHPWQDEITPDLLMRAYSMGIFPMSEHRDDPEIFWVDPHRRGIFPLAGFHVSRSLAKAIRAQAYNITVDHDFEGVVDGCADRTDTWINGTIRCLYSVLHAQRRAHSIEIWQDSKLVGGVYGVTLGTAFFGESMFSRTPNASKIALAWLMELLNLNGFTLFDAQFITPHLATLGAVEISREEYHTLLKEAQKGTATLTYSDAVSAEGVALQRSTQISNRA
ncbi:leucyl/phenylalanyl-tRNA--protein transferase [Shimia gijangensis]|uniref:Leucyl/phenylalanyl-tRNA--protein transferase n=1 Tax=Shimia gijangensis TaxID=1470563 RepID=A0A1M6P3S2_9RHOB|nr:leucyl/phenylalanyl-tRNA--protein transferase [Shimia gijangensis]SHK02627.1 leucyl/phenylalanyl-tRNA--protein transferase [Shimia gijangensis]